MSNIKPGEYISDHWLVNFIINYEKEISEINSIEFKNWKEVDIDELCEKIDEFDKNLNYDTENLLKLLTVYAMGMDKIIDNVVPTKKAKAHTMKVCQPWYNNIVREHKKKQKCIKGR